MPITRMWVHGTAVHAEDQDLGQFLQPAKRYRRGWGTHFVGGPTNWYHIPIPTPALLSDVRPQLVSVFVFFNTIGTEITNVHIWDGGTLVKYFNGLSLTGHHTNGIDAANSWAISPALTIRYSLGISVRVEYLDVVGAEVVFTTAGADFLTP
jgi:hypothetical protein